MKYLKSYKIFESTVDTAKIKEALEIYAEELPFEMDNVAVYSHVDTYNDGSKRITYSVAYVHVDPSLLGLPQLEAERTVREHINTTFRKFAKKYDMEYANMDLDFDLDSRYAPDDLEVRVGFDLVQKLETFSNVTALEEALELYSEGLPFEMRNVYVSNKTQYDFDNEYDIYEVSYEHIEPSEAGNIDVKKHADAAFSKFAKRYDMEYGNPYKPWYNPSLHQLQYVERSINTTGATVDDAHDDDNNIVPYVTFTLKQIRGKKPYNKKFNESISEYNYRSIIDMLMLQLEDNGEFEFDGPGIVVSNTISLDDYQWYINNKEKSPSEEYIRSHSKGYPRKDTKDTDIPTSILVYQDYSNNTEMYKLIDQYNQLAAVRRVWHDSCSKISNLIEEKSIEITT